MKLIEMVNKMHGEHAGTQDSGTIDGPINDPINLADYRLARRDDEMIHSEIRALYSYWENLRAGRDCPERTEVDPRDIPADARHLFILEDLGQENVRFRLAGTGLLEAFGFDLRGMSARAIMEGRSRESFVALVSETIAEPGVGYARLTAPDGVSAWEIVLLPLRGSNGAIDRVIGCLHPVSGRAPEPGPVALRFTIDSMVIQSIEGAAVAAEEDREPVAGFAEEESPFEPAPRRGLRAIEGGGKKRDRDEEGTPRLRIVKDED